MSRSSSRAELLDAAAAEAATTEQLAVLEDDVAAAATPDGKLRHGGGTSSSLPQDSVASDAAAAADGGGFGFSPAAAGAAASRGGRSPSDGDLTLTFGRPPMPRRATPLHPTYVWFASVHRQHTAKSTPENVLEYPATSMRIVWFGTRTRAAGTSSPG